MASLHALMNSKKVALIVGAVALVGLAIAVPTCVGSFGDSDPNEHPVDPVPFVAQAAAADPDANPYGSRPVPKAVVEDDEPAPTPTLETSKDGDVEATLKLRFNNYEAGERIRATVKLGNRSQRDMYFPAAGEPNDGLAVVVQAADGDEVRRVVETTKNGQFPRHVARLAAGMEAEFPIVVVAEDEAPLAPGTYTAYAELRPDPRMPRLGLPLWTAPKGAVRSDAVTFTVAAKTSK